jgi:LemA protein
MVLLLIFVAAALLCGAVLLYNRLVRLRNLAENAWSQVDVQLRRRYDLIPNLVQTVRAYAAHERSTFEAVIKARARAHSAESVEEQGKAETALTGALWRLLAVAEAYPELRSEKRFGDLMEELTETEDKIAVARHIYNDSTLNYNDAVGMIPSNLVARVAGLSPRPYFEAEERSRSVPGVRP